MDLMRHPITLPFHASFAALSRRPSRVVAFVALWAACTAAGAQPQAGAELADREIQRQQERDRQWRQQNESLPDVHLQRPAVLVDDRLPDDESPCSRIERIELGGEAAERFQWALDAAHHAGDGTPDRATPRCLGAQGIERLMRRMQNAVIARGFVTTRILAQPQDLATGTLRLTLIPGRVRAIRFTPDSTARARAVNVVPMASGELLNLRDIEQALEGLQRLPDTRADIQVVPAEPQDGEPSPGPGESDLVIHWILPKPWRLALSADDSGSDATGRYQGTVSVAVVHPLALNDLLTLSVRQDLGGGYTGDRGSRGWLAHYAVPWGYWTLGLGALQNHYHQAVAGASQTYVYSGISRQSDIRLARMVWRDAVRKTQVSWRGWRRSAKNFIDDTEVEVQRRRTAGWDLGLHHVEGLDHGKWESDLVLRRGTGALRALPAPEEAFGEGASRVRLTQFETHWVRGWRVGDYALFYDVVGRAQRSSQALTPIDRFSIGGRTSVRGFDGEQVLSASRGWLVRNELMWLPAQDMPMFFYLGVDAGQVGGAGSERLAGRRLAGAVVGVRGNKEWLFWDLFAGRPLRQPDGFVTARRVSGFSLQAVF